MRNKSTTAGTPASGGVDATSGTGNEYFFSAQVIGNNVIETDDLFPAGLRFAGLTDLDHCVLGLGARFAELEDMKVNLRLRFDCCAGDNTGLVAYSVLPSVLFNKSVTRDPSLELEAGAQWTDSTLKGVEETATDVFFTVGYRYDFYADGQKNQPRVPHHRGRRYVARPVTAGRSGLECCDHRTACRREQPWPLEIAER